MSTSSGLSRARLRPPRVPHGAVERAELVDKLLAALDRPMVTLIAGAGYGKTTLMAMAARADRRRWAWCSCDSRLQDGRALAMRIAAAVSVGAPGFDAGLDFTDAQPDEIGSMLSEAIFEIATDESVIAIDDVHLLPDRACEIFPSLVAGLPGEAHLLIASRHQLPITGTKLRMLGVAEITEAELRFSDRTAADLVAALGPDLRAESRQEVVREAEGWAAGLVLGAQVGGGGIGRDPDFRFDYLAEEVVSRLTAQKQDFLMATAVATRFDPRLASFLTRVEDPADAIGTLMSEHLFVSRIDSEQEWYRYHHLFKEFLNQRLKRGSPKVFVETHRRAAEWWRQQQEPVEAIRHLIAAEDLQAAAEYLEPLAEGLISGPDAEQVAGWLEAIGPENWSKRPGLVATNAALLLNKARHEEAFAAFDRAIADLVAAGDHERAAAVTVRLQQAMLTAGTQPDTRIRYGQKAVGLVSQSAQLMPVARIMLATAFGYGVRFEEARRELAAAEVLPSYNEAAALMAGVARAFYIDFWRESPVDALATLSSTRVRLSENPTDDPLGLYPVTAMLEVYELLELGYFEEAKRLTDAIHEIFEKAGMGREALRRTEGWVRSALLAGMGDWDLLAEWIETPPKAAVRDALTSYSYRYRVPASLLQARYGRRAEAEAQIHACAQEMSAFGLTFDRPSFLCDLAKAALHVGNDRLASQLTLDALKEAETIGSPWLRVRGQIWVMTTATGDVSDRLEEALELTERFGLDPAWTHRERERATSLLTTAVERGLGPPGLAERLQSRLGERLRDVQNQVVPIGVRSPRPWTAKEVTRASERLEAGDLALSSLEIVEQARLMEPGLGQNAQASAPERRHQVATRFLLAAAEQLYARGELEGALVCRRRLVEQPSAEESWHQDLMILLEQTGRPAEALRHYYVHRARLHRDHGRSPSQATEDLYATLVLARDQGSRDTQARHMTVVFTDIVGSTELAEQVGDRRWARIVADHEDLLAVHAGEFGGRVVKTQGDGAMLVFERPSDALDFAASVQRALDVSGETSIRLPVRIGVHAGAAVLHGEDYLGRTVIFAARLMDQCSGGEVLVSDDMRRSSGVDHLGFTGPRRVGLKGLAGDHQVWRLDWVSGESKNAG